MSSGSNWFETWFNTPYYYLLYKLRDENEAADFIDALLKYLKPPVQASILDLACGKGRHSIYLADKGFDVTGVDLSYKYMKEAKQFEHERLSFFVHDMRMLFRVNYFDIIFNFFTSFGYFDNSHDDYKTIRSAAAGLKMNSCLIIDFFNVNYVLDHLIEEDKKTIEGIEFTIRKEYLNGFIEKDIFINDHGKELKFHERVKAITSNEFEEYFQRCGLHMKDVLGDYQLNAFDEKISERLILVAQK